MCNNSLSNVALAEYVPSAEYVCKSEATPLLRVLLVKLPVPSPKLNVMLFPESPLDTGSPYVSVAVKLVDTVVAAGSGSNRRLILVDSKLTSRVVMAVDPE